jgi:hypothetical protein
MRSNFEHFRAFTDEIARVEKAKQDYLPRMKQVTMTDPEHLDLEGLGTFGITQSAHRQLADRVGIPIDYYRKTAEVPGLREYNVNAWSRQEPEEKRLIRTLDGNVRAVLGARFKPLDNFMLLDAIIPSLKDLSAAEMLMRTYAVSETNMYLQVVFPKARVDIEPHKHEFLKEPITIMAGITIRNSETGHAALDIRKMTWNLVCWNGAIRESVLRQYHLGRELENGEGGVGNIWSEETLKKEIELIRLRARDIIRDAMDPANLQDFLMKAEGAIDDRIAKPMDEVIVNVTKRFALTKDEGQRVMENVLLGGKANMSRWGLANGVNMLAHDLKDVDRQYEAERIGGEIVELSPSEWKVLAS